jgi:DNA-binding LytR/AlgR family response regulator
MQTAYRCLIADDEKPAHSVIRSLIDKCEGLEYAASAYNGAEALQLMAAEEFDILFLDINMPLLNGIELMEQLPLRPVTIVTTAYSDFALDSYKNDAVDYLVKPIALADFAKAVAKAKIFCNALKSVTKNKNLILKTGREEIDIATESVICIESYGNYLKVYLSDRQMPIVVYGALSAMVKDLDADFVRVHKSFIINTTHIKTIDGTTVMLSNNMNIPVGRKYQILLNSIAGRK